MKGTSRNWLVYLGVFIILHSGCSLFSNNSGLDNESSVEYKYDSSYNAYLNTETPPKFPGGAKKLEEYISKKITYPDSAKQNNITGEVSIGFVVDKTGNVTNTQVIEGVQKDLNKEALRIVKTMPNWEPGKIDGEPVSIRVVFPIKFSLD